MTVLTVWSRYFHSNWLRAQRCWLPFFPHIRRWSPECEPRLELKSMSGFLLHLCCHVSGTCIAIGLSPVLGVLQFDITGWLPGVFKPSALRGCYAGFPVQRVLEHPVTYVTRNKRKTCRNLILNTNRVHYYNISLLTLYMFRRATYIRDNTMLYRRIF